MQVDVLGLDHDGKVGSAKEAGDTDGQEGTQKGPALRGVSDAQVALAASTGSSKAHVKARRLVAKKFYTQHGKIYDESIRGMRNPTATEARPQLKGIDYSKPITVGPPPGTPARLGQWQRPGGRQGQFYAEPGTKPQALGIHDKAGSKGGKAEPKVSKNYAMNQNTEPYMKSTAGPIKDTWSHEGHSYYCEGGADQYYVPNQTSAKPIP